MEEITDTNGNRSMWKTGDRVYVIPLKKEATVICQILHWNGSDSYWGNVILKYSDSSEGTSHCWQLMKINA